MTKASENSVPKTVGPKKGKWPLVIGAWAVVEAMASGWGIGAAFLAHQASTALPDEKKLAILKDPEQARRLSSFQASQLLSPGQFNFLIYLIPFILYLTTVGFIKLFLSNYLLVINNHSLLSGLIADFCAFSYSSECPQLLSVPYIITSVFFCALLVFMFVLQTKKLILHNFKSYLFAFVYNKWGATIFLMAFISIFILTAPLFIRDFVGFILKFINPSTLNLNPYLQGSLAIVFVPIFFYIIIIYLISTFIFLKLLNKIQKYKTKPLLISVFNNIITIKSLSQIKKALQEPNIISVKAEKL